MPSGQNTQYQAILEISRLMLEAGKAQEWDSLIALEKQRQGLFAAPAAGDGRSTPDIAATLDEILSCDKELMEKVEHWLQHARILLRMPPARGD